MKKNKPLNEFRYNKNTKHMNYIFAENDKRYIGMGLTTEPKTFGIKNMRLNKNPHRNHSEISYVRNGIIVNKKEYYARKPDNRYDFRDICDKKNVASKKRNYKRIKKQKNK